MNRIIFIGVVFLCVLASAPLRAEDLCTEGEQTFFSCTIKKSGKLVSLCGSQRLTKTEGYLQYRFGIPAKIELEFPKDRQKSREQFYYSHYFRALVDRTEVRFKNQGYSYSIYVDDNEEEKPTVHDRGVRISSIAEKSKEVDLACGKVLVNQLSLLEPILPCDPEGVDREECVRN